MASINSNITLCICGLTELPTPSCPTLDSTASIQITDELIDIYQSRIDALINQLGKHVWLDFDPIKSYCRNCLFDVMRNRSKGIYRSGGPIPFSDGRRCPWCHGYGFEETSVNECIMALLKWNPREADDYGISMSDYQGVVRIKTYLTHVPSLIKAKTAIVNYDISNMLKLRVKKIKGPIPVGLREDRYCISFWELLDD